MSVRTDVVNLVVNVNGNQGQNKLNDLRKSAVDITAEMKHMKKNTEEYIAAAKQLDTVETEMAQLKKQIGITALTQKELTAELHKLRALKGSAIPFSSEMKQLEKDIKAVKNRLYDVTNGVQGFSSFMSKIKTEVKQFGALAVGFLGFQFLADQFRNIISGAGKLSDSLADIQRVTGLTAEETQKLNKSLGELDTRSSTGSLREIAVVAGKLGVEKEGIISFTEALDKLVVALGDELGDANTIAEQLGKIVTVFDGKITGENVSKLGNAFVSLANSGASSADFIADFDQRLSGIAKSANIGLGALSGLGAGLQELGGRVESSSTAVQNIINQIAGDLPTAAKAAGMSVNDFTKLFATDATEAMLRFAEGITKNATSFPDMVAKFSEADATGARLIETLSKMGQSADFLRGRIDAGKQGIQEFGEINDAFAIKNQTFGAELDKLDKKIYSLVTSQAAISFAQGLVRGFSSFIDVLQALPAWIDRNKQALILLAAGYALMRMEQIKSLLLRAHELLLSKQIVTAAIVETAVTKGITAAKAAWSLVTALLSGNLQKASAAMTVLNTVMKANVIGAIVTAIAAAIIIIDQLTNKTKAFNIAAQESLLKQKTVIDVQKRAQEMYGDSIAEIEKNRAVLVKETSSYDEKKKAIDNLIRINPAFINTLKLSADGHLSGISSIDQYIAALKRKAMAEAAEASLKDLYKKKQDDYLAAQEKIFKADEKYAKNIQALSQGTPSRFIKVHEQQSSIIRISEKQDAVREHKQNNQVTNRAIGMLEGIIKAQGDVSGIAAPNSGNLSTGAPSVSGGGGGGSTGGGGSSKSGGGGGGRDIAKETQDLYRDLAKLRQDFENGQLDADEAEIKRVSEKYADLYTRAKKLAIDTLAIDEQKAKEINALVEKQTKKKKEAADQSAYQEALQANEDLANERKQQTAQDYADGIINRGQYEQQLTSIELQEQKARWDIAKGYAGLLDGAKKDEVKEHRKYEAEKTKATIEENERRKKFNDDEKLAKAKTNVLAQAKGSGGELQARKNLLETQFELETEAMDARSEMYKNKEAEKNAAIEELDKEHFRARVDQYTQYAQYIGSAIESLVQLANARGERELNNEKKKNEEKKNSFKKQLDAKLMSEQQYNLSVAQADEALAEKEKNIRREQAKREKAMALFQAVVNTAAGIAKAIPVVPLMVMAGIAGALQIATIASAPLPEFGAGDWVRKGDKHKDSSGGIPAMIERDEAVMSAAAMTNEEVLSVTGTTAQITSALNSRSGGKAWEGGAKVISMQAWKNDKAPIVNPALPRIMETGGFAVRTNAAAATDVANNNNESADILRQILTAQKENTEAINTMKTRLKAIVSIKEFDEQKELYDNAKKVSGL